MNVTKADKKGSKRMHGAVMCIAISVSLVAPLIALPVKVGGMNLTQWKQDLKQLRETIHLGNGKQNLLAIFTWLPALRQNNMNLG